MSWRLQTKIRVLAWSGSGALQSADFLCPHVVEKSRGLSGPLFLYDTNLTCEGSHLPKVSHRPYLQFPSQWTLGFSLWILGEHRHSDHRTWVIWGLSKSLPSVPITVNIRFQSMNFWENTNIQTIEYGWCGNCPSCLLQCIFSCFCMHSSAAYSHLDSLALVKVFHVWMVVQEKFLRDKCCRNDSASLLISL